MVNDDLERLLKEFGKYIEEDKFKEASEILNKIVMYYKGVRDQTSSDKEREVLDIWIFMFRLINIIIKIMDRISEGFKMVDFRITSLNNRVKKLEEELNVIQTLKGKVSELEQRINALSTAFEALGEMKQEDCAHFENGICYHPRFASPTPHEWAKKTVKVGDSYYPEVDVVFCSLCPYFVEEEKEKSR